MCAFFFCPLAAGFMIIFFRFDVMAYVCVYVCVCVVSVFFLIFLSGILNSVCYWGNIILSIKLLKFHGDLFCSPTKCFGFLWMWIERFCFCGFTFSLPFNLGKLECGSLFF